MPYTKSAATEKTDYKEKLMIIKTSGGEVGNQFELTIYVL